MKRYFLGTLASLLLLLLVLSSVGDTTPPTQAFEANWTSLQQYQCPEWFRDAKFGIFLHWGINSVPGFSGHYGRYMYWQQKPDPVEDTGWKDSCADVYHHHVKTYGHPSRFGYKDFIPLWTAEKFDPDALAAFFKECGARYVVPMAVHHDNFDNWDSKHHRWNAVAMGPQRDIIGEWKKACQKHGLRFGASTHFNGGHEHIFFQGRHDTTGPLKGVPYDTVDPCYVDFYHKRTPDRKKILPYIGKHFYDRHMDLIDKYQPDLLYFDGGLPYGDYGLRLAAHFFNQNIANHGGKLDAVLSLKRGFPEGAATLDIEKGQADRLREHPWQTDTTLNDGWFYLGRKKSQLYYEKAKKRGKTRAEAEMELRMTAGLVIDNLVDIVSKNGNMLLNVGQRADGSLPDIFRQELKKIGRWLKLNSEAIYGTRPWITYGEGPTQMKTGFRTEPDKPLTQEDVRFTTKGDALYAIVLDWPDSKHVTIKSLPNGQKALGPIGSVELLGHAGTLSFQRDTAGLTIELPDQRPCDYAYVFKINPEPPVAGQIIVGTQAPEMERYAARELQRYLYQLSGSRLPIYSDTVALDRPSFVIGTQASNARISHFIRTGVLSMAPNNPGEQGYVLKRLTHQGQPIMVIAGADTQGSLYGAYGLLDDHYQVGFYPAGDVLPDTKTRLRLPDVDERKTPIIAIRGFLPWTNFPQSATVFSWEDWKFVLDQTAKMRMNFIHIHNYNKTQGHYPVRYTEHNEMFHSFSYKDFRQRPWMPSAATGHPWCCPGWNVNEYRFGAADLFGDYNFGADCTLHNESYTNDETFLKGSSEFQKVIRYAHSRGIKIGLGLDIDLIPRDYGVEPNDPEIIESRVTQITNDYPDLDYLLCFQSEKHSTWTSDEYKQWRHIFGRLYEEIGKRSPHTRLAVSGWGLNPKSIETLPEDVICAPIARYGASFENGQIYGNREYWGCPWLETDGNCSQHYYPYACHLSTTIASYQKRAPNMKGLYCLTWRISDAIEPKLSYIAKAPWDTENKYKSSHDVYHEYAQRCYGSNVAHAITEIINENEAFAEDHGECRQIPVFSGSDRKALQRPIIEIGTLCFYGENPQAAIEIPASKETKKYGATIGVKTSDKEGTYITSITTGNWIRYEIELASEVTTFEVRAKAARDCDIELRLNEFNGLLLGTCVAKASKDWQSFKTRISKISGKQTLYVRPLGQEMNDREKVKQQLATIDRQIDQAVGAGSRYRLQLLRERLAGVQAYLDIDKHFPTITWEELPGAFEPWVKSFMHRVYDISSLGNIMSTQHRFVKERYVVKETKLRAAQSVKAPSGVEARGTNVGAMIRWQNEQTQTQGYYVYRDGQRLNDQMLNAETTVFTDKANGTYRYQVTAVNNQGHESPRSIPSLCPAGSADEQAPRIIVISPPTSLTPGQALDVKATILDDRTYDSISAFLYYRKPGQKTWQQSLMERRTKAIFGKRVSGEAMTDAGLEYYVLASDGDNIDRYPATAPVLPLSVVAWHMEDTTAPDTPKQVAVSEQILKWSTSNDAFWYRLYRSRQPDFRPGPASFLTYAPLDITAFKDNGLDWNGQPLKGRWYYRITAQDQSDNESPASQAIAVEW